MSMKSIKIHRDLPVINGFVQVPPNQERDKTRMEASTAVNAIAGSQLVFLPQGSGRERGLGHGQQTFLRLPGLAQGGCCPVHDTDPVSLID